MPTETTDSPFTDAMAEKYTRDDEACINDPMLHETTVPQPGQVWRQTLSPGMWRTVLAVHPGGVEWSAGPLIQPKAPVVPRPEQQGFSPWHKWTQWVRETGAINNGQ